MKATLSIENPADIEMTLCITMTVRDWMALNKQLQAAWPSSDLSRHVTNLIWKARKEFEPDLKDDAPTE